jgi:phosphate transport system substrate-binding protein
MLVQAKADGDAKERLRVEGSTSMGQMMREWAEAYASAHPNVKVEVVSNGTPVGLKAIQEGRADLAMASRKISAGEIDQFSAKGIKLLETNIGLEGVAIVVNKDNPVGEITLEQLKGVLNGTYTTWEKLVGWPKPITFWLRKPSKSGTSVFLQEQVLKGADFAKNARFTDYYDWVTREVAQVSGGFGVFAFGFVDKTKTKVLSIKKDEKSPAVQPSHESFIDGTYPLTRPFFLYCREPMTKSVAEFVEYCKVKSVAQR